MKTSLEYLPEHKQQELQMAAEIILEMVEPEMLILFGSYARGDWVEDMDPETLYYRYQSDYDLLVVTATRQQASKIEQNSQLKHRLMKTIHRTPISLIAEDIQFVNRRLKKSQYFYIDIKREGILLYDSGKFELAEPKELSTQERKKLAQEDFEYWFDSALRFYKGFVFYLNEGDNNNAAFLLHQVTERLYNTISLVFTRYKPNTHDLGKLSHRVASIEPRFLTIFPQGSEEERRRFELLRGAYVDARYKKSYTITVEELEWLSGRVQALQQLTEELCKARIVSY